MEKPATIDEEFMILDSALAALKIEHEIFFNNPIKRPPADLKWKVLSLLRKFSDDSKITFSQRYRYYLMAQRYAIYCDLWRIREDGYRRPQDALVSLQGAREEERQAAHPIYGLGHHSAGEANSAFAVACPLRVRNAKNSRPSTKLFIRSKKEGKRGSLGHLRLVSPLRFEENQTNPQGIRLP